MGNKRFNVTGLCVPHKHYMVDISGKLAQIRKLIDDEHYFTINRARQYGKTTTLIALTQLLKDDYLVVPISFEGLGDESFKSPKAFCITFMRLIQKALRFTSADEKYISKWLNKDADSFTSLSDHITDMCENRKLVLFIDEVDKTSNNRVFLNFLSMLRTKYLARSAGMDYTFHSVILAGVYNIKNIKLKIKREEAGFMVEEEVKTYNSPWNIAVNFDIDMSFSAPEIATMLADYENAHQTGMDIAAISEEIRLFTSGYPFMVSRICQCIHEELGMDWTLKGVQNAVDVLLYERNTLFDDMSKNLENNKELYKLVYDVLIVGKHVPYSIDSPAVDLGVTFEILKKAPENNHIIVSNKVYEIRICNYFISKDAMKNSGSNGFVLQRDIVRDGRFDMELCLRKFAEHYTELYNDRDIEFLERHGRMLFLSYLKPLLNGQGFYHLESQFTDLRRMDIVVDFGPEQFIIELKVWRGEEYRAEAHEQLCGYLGTRNAEKGYMLTFDFRKKSNKTGKAEWIEIQGKRLFEIFV